MEHNECITCIKDGTTGVCRDIKDKKARELIESLQNTVNAITGVDGGHLATDEDLQVLTNKVNEIVTAFNNLDKKYVSEDNITAVNNAINIINNKLVELEEDIENIPTSGGTGGSSSGVINTNTSHYKLVKTLQLTSDTSLYEVADLVTGYKYYCKADQDILVNNYSTSVYFATQRLMTASGSSSRKIINNGSISSPLLIPAGTLFEVIKSGGHTTVHVPYAKFNDANATGYQSYLTDAILYYYADFYITVAENVTSANIEFYEFSPEGFTTNTGGSNSGEGSNEGLVELEGRVTTLEGQIDTKANASDFTALQEQVNNISAGLTIKQEIIEIDSVSINKDTFTNLNIIHLPTHIAPNSIINIDLAIENTLMPLMIISVYRNWCVTMGSINIEAKGVNTDLTANRVIIRYLG